MTRVTVLAALLATACGGSTTTTPPPIEQGEPRPRVEAPPADEPERSPWDGITSEQLAALVDERARARIREVQPDFDVAQLDAYRATPASAPELSGRTVERLFDLAMVEMVRGRLEQAEQTVLLVRARAKNRNSAFAGNTVLAEVRRRRAGDDRAAQQRAVEATFRELPRPRFGSATVVFQLYQQQEQLTAELEQLRTQMLSLETASDAIFYSEILPAIVRNRDTFLAAIDVVRRENEARPADRDYRFSTVDLGRDRRARPVIVGVWDTGVATQLFPNQIFVNAEEQENGQDDDGNGLADDISGVVDMNEPHTRLLFDPGADTIREYAPFLRGIMDLRAGMASTEPARRVLELMRSVTDADRLVTLERNLDAIGEWAHGTHVAGILAAGNPHAKIAVFRSAWAGEARVYFHRGPTDEELAAERRNVEAIADFINRNQVRVVNASLGFSLDYLEGQLRYEATRYRTDEEVRARAAAVHARRVENWAWVFEQCPGTLFVVAAGNSNRDVVEYNDVPAATEAPNVVAVGAVDRWGGWSTFTNSNAERVPIFDLGVDVDSVIPNGERTPLSGTSMASPNVANLAGKMLAVNPGLTPAQIVRIIVETGDPIAAPFNGRIANEQRAIQRARREPALRMEGQATIDASARTLASI